MKRQLSGTKYQGRGLHYTILCTLYLVLGTALFAQAPLIKKSDKIETIDGKKFFIHSVEKGQTLYSISRAYGTTVDIILANNQDAIDGLKSGDRLKVPYSGNSEAVKKEIDKQTGTPPKAQKETDVKVFPPDTAGHAAKKSRPLADLKTPVSVQMPPVKKDSLSTSPANIKPIGDIHVALAVLGDAVRPHELTIAGAIPPELTQVPLVDVGHGYANPLAEYFGLQHGAVDHVNHAILSHGQIGRMKKARPLHRLPPDGVAVAIGPIGNPKEVGGHEKSLL